MKSRLFLLLPLVVFISCNTSKNATYIPDQEEFVKYFSSTLEQENLINPQPQHYKKSVAETDIPRFRETIWTLWKQANQQRLATWKTIAEDSKQDSMVWDLPDQKKMLFAILKKGNRPAEGYPLFINLHGGGCYPKEPGPWTSAMNNSEWKAAKTLGARYADGPSLYFIPRMPDDRRGRWYHRASIAAWIRAWQLSVLSGDVNPDKAYILGISEGGYGSFRMGIFLADYFAAAGPMAGPVWVNQEPVENLRNTAFRIEVGENDNAYGRSTNAKDWKARLDSAASKNPGQFIHTVEIQKGRGHGIDYFKTAPWLKQFTRKAYPDTLSAVYYAQCDSIYGGEPNVPCTYRKGFGYLRLDGLSQTGERRFNVFKDGNVYHVNSSNVKAEVKGTVKLYVDRINFDKPVQVFYNDKMIHNKKLLPNIGTMAESMALFGDPRRIFAAAVTINIE
ncbi:hypothetical protein [Pedobacter frigoris]|uniref:hypothetical protein n=1 Tax=Pedobacter frigoris TaxID=2571272 RepID=UPI00292CAA38|nr:hypothetical protein [Pedobacter frigoris]